MTFSAGTRLGPYEILALIGKGGMGEVYRAHDPRLNRDVAIKVSNAQFTERFTREARTIAALNHTNICHLYDVGPNYLVMEFVEGQDLHGPMDLADALPIIEQLIDGIDAAHEKNIIHRDLKPANIKVTPEGVVKILDFGLAKAMEPAPSSDGSPDNSPTLTMGATQAGAILGTAAYMSPEQAKGKIADRRADIWSFGVVLHELLTGTKMFAGETAIEILGGVLNKEPDVSTAPPQVHKLLRWCLEKDRKHRLQAIGDARRLLRETGPAEAAEALPASRSRHAWTAWAAAAVFFIAAALLAFLHFRETPPEVRVVNATLLPPEGSEFAFSSPYALPTLSPDGTRIVFGAKAKDGNAQLWLRRLDSPTAQPLTGTEDAAFPFWSPDSRWVGFGQGTRLKKIDTQGGPPVAVTDLSASFGGGSWGPDGIIVFGINGAASTLFRVAAAGGTAAPATTLEQGKESSNHRYPWFLPDGRHFLYTNQQAGDLPVRVGSLDEPDKPGKVVAQAHSQAVYAQGHLLYLRENTLMAQPFDADGLVTTGEAVPVVEEVPTYTNPSRAAGFTVSANGLLVYQTGPGAGGTQSRLVWKDRKGKAVGNLGEPIGRISGMALSPDDKHLAVTVQTGPVNPDIWIYDTGRGIPTRFTFDPGSDGNPVWSADGSTLYFRSNRQRPDSLFRKSSNGVGTEELLLSDINNVGSTSRDGKLLLFSRAEAKTKNDLWVLPLAPVQIDAKPEPRVFLQTPFNEVDGQFSPDGKWVAYRSDESGRTEVYAAPFPGPGGKRQISSGGATAPRWSRDGRELFYAALDGQLMAAEIATRNGTLEVARVEKLFIIDSRTLNYAFSADGQKVLVIDDGTAASLPLTLLQNWPASMRK